MPKALKPVKKPGHEPGFPDSQSSALPWCHAASPWQLAVHPSRGHCSLHGLAQRSCIAGKGHLHLCLSAELKLEFTGEWLCWVFTQHPTVKPTFLSFISCDARGIKYDQIQTYGSCQPIPQSRSYSQKQYPGYHSLFLLLSIKTLLIRHCRPLGSFKFRVRPGFMGQF